jgi:EpsI family protein
MNANHAPLETNSAQRRRLMALGVVSTVTAMGYQTLKPTSGDNVHQAVDFKLDDLVPRHFAGWRNLVLPATVVDPFTQSLLDKLYSQTLSRVYADASGYQIMLAISYGADQRGSLEAHKPEVCYPAQGFSVKGLVDQDLQTQFGNLPVRRLETQKGNRQEPVTYWFTIGELQVKTRWDKRLSEIRLALTGRLPDGLLFRVSSIDTQTQRSWKKQDQFIQDMLGELTPKARRRLAGL